MRSGERGRSAPRARRRRRCACGRTLKSPPKISGRPSANARARSAAASSSRSAEAGLVLTCMLATQTPRLEAGQGHHPQLGPPGEHRPGPLGDASRRCRRARVVLEPPSQAPSRSGPALADDRGEGLQPVAAAVGTVGLRPEGGGQTPLPARRELLEERDVPLDPVDPLGELARQVPVHLLVLLAADRPRAPVALVGSALQVLLGRPVAAVEDVPGECAKLHRVGGSLPHAQEGVLVSAG